MIWIVLLAVIAFAAAMVAVGIRGRRIDDHPICRACGFDVVGIYPANQRCPECGTSLAGPYTVRTGHRRLRRVPLVVGSLLLFAGLVAAIGVGASAAGAFDWNTIKPEWLLLREFSASQSIPARDELIRRQRNDRLSPASTRKLIDAALDVHGDPNATWDVVWPAFLEDVWRDGLLTAQDLSRYAHQTITVAMSAEPKARPDSFAVIRSKVTISRILEGPEPIAFSMKTISATLAGRESVHPHHGGGMSTTLHETSITSSMPLPVPDLPPGSAQARLVERLTFHIGSTDNPAIATYDHSEELEVEIVPEDTQLVELIDDPEVGSELRRALKLQTARIVYRSTEREIDGVVHSGFTNIWIEFEPATLPVNIAFDVFVVCDDRRIGMGTFSARSGPTHGPFSLPRHMHIRNFDCNTIDLILRPSIRSAEAWAMDRIWGEEIVYENVELEPPATTPAPAPR